MLDAKSVLNAICFGMLVKLQRGILTFTSLSVVLLMTIVVILRYILKIDLFGVEDFLVIGSIWLYFIGGSHGSYDESHIRADILEVYFKGTRVYDVINVIASIITVVVAIVFTRWALDLLIWGIVKGGTSPAWKIPQYVPQSALLIGFFLMSLYFVIYLLRDAKQMLSNKK